MTPNPRFSPATIRFLEKAGRQKRETWLEKNQAEYEKVLLDPLKHLARTVKSELDALAPDYNFPQKGIGRLKRSARSVAEHGGGLYKDWVTWSAARPRTSRFEHNPNIFFLINPEDVKEPVLIAGGLYMPSSRQMRQLRETVARDASPFEELFASKAFASCFRGGFSDEKISSRVPKGYDPSHPRLKWIRLQAFFVWKPYSRREFASKDFAALFTRDARQILRLNQLMEKALEGKLPVAERKTKRQDASLLDRLEGIGVAPRPMDF